MGRQPLKPVEDGWYEWTDTPTGTRLLVSLVEADDGRYHVDGLQITGPLSAELLRSIPLGRIEASANALLHGSGAGSGGRQRPRANARIADSLRANAVQGYPDSFYDAVASAYRTLVSTSSRPIAELAAANEVPITTAQRWVREARSRGKLPPGRRGKAG